MTRQELRRIGSKLGINCKGTGKPGPCKSMTGGQKKPSNAHVMKMLNDGDPDTYHAQLTKKHGAAYANAVMKQASSIESGHTSAGGSSRYSDPY